MNWNIFTTPILVPPPGAAMSGSFTPTTVVNKKYDEYDVYIGRPSVWGNPFIIGQDGTRLECVNKYAEWIKSQTGLLANLHILRGKRLGCYCSPEQCHGNVLAALADVY